MSGEFCLRTGDLVLVDIDSEQCRGYVPSMVRYDIDPLDEPRRWHEASLEVDRTAYFLVLHVHPAAPRWLFVTDGRRLGWLSVSWVEQAYRHGERIDL